MMEVYKIVNSIGPMSTFKSSVYDLLSSLVLNIPISIVNDIVKMHSTINEPNYGIHCSSNELLKNTNSKDLFKKVVLT